VTGAKISSSSWDVMRDVNLWSCQYSISSCFSVDILIRWTKIERFALFFKSCRSIQICCPTGLLIANPKSTGKAVEGPRSAWMAGWAKIECIFMERDLYDSQLRVGQTTHEIRTEEEETTTAKKKTVVKERSVNAGT
jgi:hypothetical protein